MLTRCVCGKTPELKKCQYTLGRRRISFDIVCQCDRIVNASSVARAIAAWDAKMTYEQERLSAEDKLQFDLERSWKQADQALAQLLKEVAKLDKRLERLENKL